MSARGLWIAAILLDLVGTGLLVAGLIWDPLLIFLGLAPLLCGWLLLGLLLRGEALKRRQPERYPDWIWWVSLVARVAAVSLLAIPLMVTLLVLRMLGLRELYGMGVVLSGLGALALGAAALAAVRAIRRRARDRRTK